MLLMDPQSLEHVVLVLRIAFLQLGQPPVHAGDDFVGVPVAEFNTGPVTHTAFVRLEQVEQFVKRLRGIGYDGYVSFEWDRLWLTSLAPGEQVLPAAAKTLQGWVDEATAVGAKGFSDAAPMNKELKKLLDAAKKKREPAKAISS